MNIKRKEIRQRHFATGGLIIVSILGCVGMLLIFLSGIFNIKNLSMLYVCVSENGIMIIFGLFFFIVFLYCWLLFFLNVIIKPKKEILYLYKNKNNEVYFINRKGKKFECENHNIKENHYYYVLKTRDYIYEILGESNEIFNNWTPKEKKSYWLNFYSPIGNFEDIFLLPIVYVILLPGLLSFIMSEGYEKIFGLIFSIVPLYVIGYDLIYKIRLKKTNNKVDDTFFVRSYDVLIKTISIIAVTILCIFLINIFLRLSDFTSKLIFAPFLGCGLCSAGTVISNAFKNYKLKNIFSKGYIIIFLIYWFGFITFWTIGIIKQEGNYLYGLFSVPFLAAGIFMIYKYFIKK